MVIDRSGMGLRFVGCPTFSRSRRSPSPEPESLVSLRSLHLLAALSVIGLSACDQEAAMRRLTPADADARARAYLQLFTAGYVDSATARLHPALRGAEADQQLAKIGELLDAQRLDSIHVVGAQTNVVNGVRHVNMTYEMRSPRSWMVANVGTIDSAGGWFVEGVYVRPIDRPIEEATAFTLRGKPAVHYLWLLCTVLAAGFSFGVAGWIATRRAMPRRWRWVFASLIGLGGFSLNWATGETAVRLVHFQLASAGFMRPGLAAPWILTFAVPVGAIAALLRYRRWRAGPGPRGS
jgi:hypothetical protein